MTNELATPGRSLFPEYPRFPSMYAEEVKGLTDAQLDRIRPEKSWGHWSIRTQVSHTASVCYRWFLLRWGPVLFGNNLPRDRSLTETGGADRILDPARFHDMPDLLAALKDACDLIWDILASETLGSMREKEIVNRIQKDPRGPLKEDVREWRENVTLKIHPSGVWIDPNDPYLTHCTLEYTFRHVLWECYAHLKTIQMHKKAEGLTPSVKIPYIGYLTILKWE
jgi:hypothetical protein